MNSIPTTYDGYRFKSRTEARYAAFFNQLKVPYIYEREGYALPSGLYLPDFWLPEQKVYIEVKGNDPTRLEEKLTEELSERLLIPVIIGVDLPSNNYSNLRCFLFSQNGSAGWSYWDILWCTDLRGKLTFKPKANSGTRSFYIAIDNGEGIGPAVFTDLAATPLPNTAFYPARSATFSKTDRW
jgi:hypothetical protein